MASPLSLKYHMRMPSNKRFVLNAIKYVLRRQVQFLIKQKSTQFFTNDTNVLMNNSKVVKIT